MADIFCKENNFYGKDALDNAFLNTETEAATGTLLQDNYYAPQFVLNPNCNYYNGSLRSLSCLRRHKTSRKGQWCHRSVFSPPRIPISPCFPLKNELCSRPLRKCSLRINELAQPRKRQCIETWRNKCDVLPGFMIDRLKQNVMDEKPIAGISDAIYCYERKRLTNINNLLFNKFTTSQLQKCRNAEELKKMCILFGRNIAIKINAPINITLNSNLQKISNVVKKELTTLVKKHIDLRQYNNSVMLQEVTNKVTIWIAMILEESSNKIFEETVKEHPKYKKTNHTDLITMIKNMVTQDKIRTSELEEEEGHIVDLIDSVIEEAIDISEASDKQFVDLNKQMSNFTRDTTDLNEFRELTVDQIITSECDTEITEVTLTETLNARTSVKDNANMNENLGSYYNEEHASSNISTAEDLKEQLINDLDNIIEYVFSRPTTESKGFTNNDENNGKTIIDDDNSKTEYEFIIDSNLNNIEQTDDHYDHHVTQNDTISLSEKNVADENDVVTVISLKEAKVSLSDEIITNRMIRKLIEELVIPNEDEIVDMTAVNINSQDIMDENNKKVKLSHYFNFDFSVKPRENKQLSKSDSAEETQLKHEQDSWKPSSDYIIPNISFAGPNGLLSDADEPWPEDVPVSPLKATKSVSKSVLSLGNIIENEDSLAESLDNNNMQHSTKIILEQLNSQMVESHITNTEVLDVKPENALITKSYEKENENDPPQEWNGSYLRTIDTESTECTIKPTITETSRIGTGDQIGIEKQDDLILNAVIKKIKQQEPKFIYKIDPTTAPPWVTEDHGDPNGKLQELDRKATQIHKATAIRQWCKSLNHVGKNLDKWSNWITISCKKVSSLKQQDGKYRNPDVKRQRDEWRELQKNIDKDIELLSKLKYRTEQRLKKYHFKAKNSQLVENIQHTYFSNGYNHSRNVLELIDEIEKISSWMHRLIVSTEYAVKCKCKKNFIPPYFEGIA